MLSMVYVRDKETMILSTADDLEMLHRNSFKATAKNIK